MKENRLHPKRQQIAKIKVWIISSSLEGYYLSYCLVPQAILQTNPLYSLLMCVREGVGWEGGEAGWLYV